MPVKIAVLFDQSNTWIKRKWEECFLEEMLPTGFDLQLFTNPEIVKSYEIVFVLGYTRILPDSFITSNALILLIHESALPEGKGFSPVQYQVLAGKNEIPVCLIEMAPELDSGDIILRDSIKLKGHELLDEIRQIQFDVTIRLLIRFLSIYPNFNREKQEGNSSVYPRRTEKDDQLILDASIADQFNHFRIADNENHPVYFMRGGIKYLLKIYKQD
ncbi:MAG: methionyl-tRNA formyltransferase [Bacteroidia bacterium]|nr:methionyl-tRNA formyltransferase [Bacteroidia bacterium]